MHCPTLHLPTGGLLKQDPLFFAVEEEEEARWGSRPAFLLSLQMHPAASENILEEILFLFRQRREGASKVGGEGFAPP